jgi:hypothetical protein
MGPTNAGSDVMDALIADISRSIASGASLAEIETTLINPAPLDSDHKAALWMYAWSAHRPARRRDEALRHVMEPEQDRGIGRPTDD